MAKKENLLFLILGGFFITNALVAEFIGVKNFSLEEKLLTLDKNGSAITIGKDLIYAKDNDLFPITVYVLARSHEYNPEEDKYL